MDTTALITALTAPLPGDDPCGPDMLFSTEFDQIQAMRRADDPSLAQGEWVTDIKRADWRGVLALGGDLLAHRTKDLRLAAWWTEAATHVNGYDGMADGLMLYATLCQDMWDGVHPLPEAGDVELRVGSVSWLLGQVQGWSRGVMLLQVDDTALNLGDVELARHRGAASGGAASPAPAGAEADGKPASITLDTVSRAQRATPASRVQSALRAVRRLPVALAHLQTVVDERLGADGPGFATAREAVQAAVSGVERLAKEMGVSTSGTAASGVPALPHAATGPGAAAASEAGETGAGAATGPIGNRAQALAQLRLVAEFFRRTEPHSPVAYLAERAAQWGDMPLHEWLRAVMKEQGALGQLEELLGVSPPPAG